MTDNAPPSAEPFGGEPSADSTALAVASPVERFDQLVRTVRFILAGRQAMQKQ
ncbi:MAG: hypothetical protein ACKV2O_00960 [Acidimicrobiales bacterium]